MYGCVVKTNVVLPFSAHTQPDALSASSPLKHLELNVPLNQESNVDLKGSAVHVPLSLLQLVSRTKQRSITELGNGNC